MKITCDVIRDLLPLAAEELASEDSMDVVREHLGDCEKCRKAYEDMKKPPVIVPEEPDLKRVRRELWKRRFLTALCAVLVVCGLGCWGLSWLTAPVYLDEKVITDVVDNGDGTVTLYMDAAAVGKKTFQYELDVSGSGETFAVWTSHWLELKWREPVPRTEDITRSVAHDGVYYFTGRDGEMDLLLYENPQKFINGGKQTLPRLYLSLYFQMSLLLGAVLLLLAFVLRRRRAGKWLALVGSFLCCYGLCQGIVCGFTFASFFATQEFLWGAGMGLCLWGALMCIWAMRKKT